MDRQASIELAGDALRRTTVLDGDQYIIVELAGAAYAIPLGVVQEVEHVPSIAAVPGSSRWVRGVVNLRGSVLTLVDLGGLLELDPWRRTGDARMLIVGGDDPVALAVDRLRGMRRLLDRVDIHSLSNLPGRVADYSLGLYKENGEYLSVLNITGLLDDAERDVAMAGAVVRLPEPARGEQ